MAPKTINKMEIQQVTKLEGRGPTFFIITKRTVAFYQPMYVCECLPDGLTFGADCFGGLKVVGCKGRRVAFT